MRRTRTRTVGEFLSGYLKRLEGADDQRIRVDSDTSDNKGDVIVQPVLMLGKDTNDDIRPAKMDTEGRLDVVGVAPTQQVDAFLTITNPVSGTKYEVLPTTELVRIRNIAIRSTHTVTQALAEVHVTVDGISYSQVQNATSNTWYLSSSNRPQSPGLFNWLTQLDHRDSAFLFEGRSVKIEMEVTEAIDAGTITDLRCRVKWAKW